MEKNLKSTGREGDKSPANVLHGCEPAATTAVPAEREVLLGIVVVAGARRRIVSFSSLFLLPVSFPIWVSISNYSLFAEGCASPVGDSGQEDRYEDLLMYR